MTSENKEEKVEVTEYADGTIKANGIQIFPPQTPEWEKEFEEKISPIFYLREDTGIACTKNKEIVKNFIKKQISDLKKSIREEIAEKGEEWGKTILEIDTKSLVDEILSLKSLE